MKETKLKFGLSNSTISKMHGVFAKYPQIDKVVIYGSRAKGNFKSGSDIDLTLFGNELTYQLQMEVFDDLDELLLPYTIDLSVFDNLDNAKLREHIERVGVVFYERVAGKQGWEIKKLAEVCAKITDGTHQTPKYFNEGVIFLSSKNVTSGRIDWKNIKYIDEKQHLEMHKRVAPKVNDILLAKNGTTGVAAMVDKDVVFDIYVSLALLRPLEGLLPDYLLHFINSPLAKKQFNKRLKGIGVPNLHLEEIREVEILFPPLPEQQRIVSILDKTFAAIAKAKANAEQNLKNAKELFESYLQSVFENNGEGWEEKILGEIAFVKSGGTPSRAKKEYWDGDIAWYSSGELNDLYTKAPERHINELAINNSNAKIFPKGSLLIGMYDTAALKMSIIDREATFNQAIAGVKPNDKIDLIFILHLINSIKPDLLNLRRGVRQKNLSLEKIKNIPIFLPSLKQQKAIVQKLDALSTETKKLEAIYQKKINNLEELKRSVLQKAFNGELDTSKAVAV